jgi:hypothetical protein
MKKLCLVILLAAGSLAAQTNAPAPPTQAPKNPRYMTEVPLRPEPPNFADSNCSGFVTREGISAKNLVVGGEYSPHVSQFGGRDLVFLSGEGMAVGGQFRLVRRVADKNRVEAFPGQYKLVKDVGDQWADLGYGHVVQMIDGSPMAMIDFSCQPIVVGDIAVPWTDRPVLAADKATKMFQEFGVPTASTTGMIVQARDFDFLLGTGKKVYLNIGAAKGLKPGDHLRVTRGYDWHKDVRPIDRLSTFASMSEETSDRMPSVPKGMESKYPRRGLGEMVVLWATPESAIAMITLSREDIHIGDQVELETAAVEQAQQ